MATITYRLVKGQALTNAEIDANFENLNDELATKLDAVDYNASDVLAKLLTVDGASSQLDADRLDGLDTSPLNIPSTVVNRDSNGNFAANEITASKFIGQLELAPFKRITFEGDTDDSFETTLTVQNPTQDRTISLPNVSGTLVSSGDTGTVTNTMLQGNIANSKLSNSAITIDGVPVQLGGSVSIASANFDWSGNHKFIDDNFVLKDNFDASKQVKFQVSNVTSQSTVTLTVPSLSGTIATETWTQNNFVNTTGDTLTGFLTLHSNPTSAMHAATKAYVDSMAYTVPLWANNSTLTNISNTYRYAAAGTKVAYWETRTYGVGTGNGGATISDKYYRVVRKNSNGSWSTVAG